MDVLEIKDLERIAEKKSLKCFLIMLIQAPGLRPLTNITLLIFQR